MTSIAYGQVETLHTTTPLEVEYVKFLFMKYVIHIHVYESCIGLTITGDNWQSLC